MAELAGQLEDPSGAERRQVDPAAPAVDFRVPVPSFGLGFGFRVPGFVVRVRVRVEEDEFGGHGEMMGGLVLGFRRLGFVDFLGGPLSLFGVLIMRVTWHVSGEHFVSGPVFGDGPQTLELIVFGRY